MISSGLKKLKAHLIAFYAPTPKVYEMLPPPREDMDEVLAILFTGPSQPAPEDLKRLPLLVQRNNVKRVLEWLKLNHVGYSDIVISDFNLASYPKDRSPIEIVYRKSLEAAGTIDPSAHPNPDDTGIVKEDCPFVVHGIMGDKMLTKTTNELKGIAVHHWQSNGKALRVGHSSQPRNLFNNLSLYPDMFPWLFPYGLGGLGSSSSRMSV
ncbi:hypothetical protein C0992_006479, partial [Termitomyces sp. T32_za158]